MLSLLSTKFHEILFSSFRGVALTNCVKDRRTGQEQYVSPPKWGGDIISNKQAKVFFLLKLSNQNRQFMWVQTNQQVRVVAIGLNDRAQNMFLWRE
jgi:hypothetical protein